MLSHFGASVVGHGFAQRCRNAAQALGEGVKDASRRAVVEFDQHDVAAGSLNDGANSRSVSGPLNEITFPVTWDNASGNLRGTKLDRCDVLQACESALNAPAGAAPGMAQAQHFDEISAQGAARLGVDGAIDGFVADLASGVHELESASNLLWGIAKAKPADDDSPQG